jgi:hypothetical protein
MSETETTETTETEEYDNPGIEGQIQYPEAEVDAERAAAYAAGKEEFLYPDDEGTEFPRSASWSNPADNRNAEQVENNETEPEAMRHEGNQEDVRE